MGLLLPLPNPRHPGDLVKPVDRLVWVDLETTGLDPERDVILEVAIVITDGKLEELTHASWVVKPEGSLPSLDPIVGQMHGSSGLLADAWTMGQPLHQVDVRAAAAVFKLGAAGGPIAGSTPQFDLAFIRKYMPILAGCFNHRVFDVSSLKQACCNSTGHDSPDDGTKPAHRALADIRDSIRVAQRVMTRIRT